ncbi:MAG: pyrimidine reductase family protein [Salinibacterium sp.]|nr:pyrimidine reductase family protein [Salinibacterium sp.]
MTARIDRLWPVPAENVTDDELVSDLGVGVRVNFVSSIDGAVTHDGRSGGLSGPGDKRFFELLRRACDVVMVGAGTVRDEGYGPMRVSAASARWRVEHRMPEHPVFAIVSRSLTLDENSRIFTEAPVRPVLVTAGEASGVDRFTEVADVIATGTAQVDLSAALDQLRARGLTNVLCEGGPSLFGSLLAADVVDELSLTIAPVLESGDSGRIAQGRLAEARGMELVHVLRSGDNLLLRYRRAKT